MRASSLGPADWNLWSFQVWMYIEGKIRGEHVEAEGSGTVAAIAIVSI